MFAQRSRWAARAISSTWRASAAKAFTTRTPFTLSWVTVATWALRDWMIHDSGNMMRRSRWPSTYTAGMISIVMAVSGRLIHAMTAIATTKLKS